MTTNAQPSPASEMPDLMPLDERMELLAELLAAASDDVDTAELAGMLGMSWLEVYERDGDEGALTAGLARFQEAIDAAPEHEDRAAWLFGLGLAHGARANLQGHADGYDRAIECLSRLYGDLPDECDRDQVAITLIDAHWERYWLLRGEPGHDVRRGLDETQRVVAALEAIAVDEGSGGGSPYPLMMAGVSVLELYEFNRARADLDRGIEQLCLALRDPPADTPRLGLAGVRLADAYRERSVLDEDLASLELSISTGERAIAWSSSNDPMTWRMVHQNQAVTHAGRWRVLGDRGDLDRAIGSWRVLVQAHAGEPMDAWKAADFGDLLRARGELDNNPAEIAEAVTLLERSTQIAPDDREAWQRWYGLGRAYHAQWSVGQISGSLEEADRCLDRALLLGVPDDDDLLSVHSELLGVGGDAFTCARGQPSAASHASAARYVQLLAEGRAALTRAVGADPDLRARLALTLAWAELGFDDPDYDDFDHAEVRGLLDVAAQLRHPSQEWQAQLDLCNGVWACFADSALPNAKADGGVADLARALASEGVDESTRERIRQILPIAVQLRAMRSGDIRLLRAAATMLRHDPPTSQGGVAAPAADDSQVLAAIFGAFDRGLAGDVEAFTGLSPVAARVMAALPAPPDSDRGPLASIVRSVRQLTAALRGEPIEARPETQRPTPTRRQHIDEQDLSNQLVAAVAHVIGALTRNDLKQLRASVADFQSLAESTPAQSLLRLGASGALGMAYLEIARRDTHDRAAARNSVHWFTEAARLARGPENPQWAKVALGLAEASRRAGNADPARSRALGLSALAAHSHRVLLQSGTDYALEAARVACTDAIRVAGWCLEDHAYDELVTTLDASRGLVLRAASISREVPDRLTDLGYPELAAQWRATAGLGRDQLSGHVLADVSGEQEIPDDLRTRVLAVLTDPTPNTRLLEPLRLGNVRDDLTALGADALVYLCAAAPPHTGLAVVVPTRGGVEVVTLRGLTIDPNTPISRYARAGAQARGTEPGTPESDGPWAQHLDDLCQWAWRSAMGELVDHVRRWQLGRPARLVLVPMGMLALVPWHAAYTVDSLRRRYAVQDVVLSYIPSARMLSEAAHHLVRPIRAALVVGNPGGGLTFAGVEARAVHAAFYPSGTYLGQPPNEAAGAGTPDEVRAWMAAAAGPSLLHFACHGHADPAHPSGAHLSLAGGTLSAADLLEATRLSKLTTDRVFLAACTTNTAGEDYDEAFSLATAFLAAGAHTVFGSLWPVPDVQTSLLMFMVHYFLNVDTLAPVDALHAAQLWMLDPNRQPPDEMPRRLAAHARRPESADPVAWAAFTHLGR